MQKKFIKNTLTLFVICVTLFSGVFCVSASAASVSSFTDLKSGAWYYDSVSYVVSKGLYNGVTATTFGPGQSMTRGMFVTVLGRMAGVNPDSWCSASITGSGVNIRSGPGTNYSRVGSLNKGNTVTITGQSGDWYAIKTGSTSGYVKSDYVSPSYHHFSDVPYGKYFTGYVIWAYEKGYISGMSNTSFQPSSGITREQICKILTSYASNNGYSISAVQSEMTFSDSSSIHDWALSAVKKMQTGGIVNGYNDGTFLPGKQATRAEVAKIIYLFSQATGTTNQSSNNSDNTSGGDSSSSSVSTETVSVPYKKIRVGLYLKTKYLDYATSYVSMESVSGGQFQYGTMDSSRNFVYIGDLATNYLEITTDGSTYTVKDGNGTLLTTYTGDSLAIHQVSSQKAKTRINSKNDYYGDFNLIQAYNASGYITLVNYVDIDDYTKCVLPYEFPMSWSSETLKAGAITVRSFAMAYAQSSAYSSFGFDILDTASCQVYKGRQNNSDSYFTNTDAAVDATANMYLTYNNKVCYCMYCASNGGTTVASSGYAYLTAKSDPYDAETGRARAGHGIGMSQWGAYVMGGKYSKTYLDILGFYYSGTTVKYGA